jgi:hypothetical protein
MQKRTKRTGKKITNTQHPYMGLAHEAEARRRAGLGHANERELGASLSARVCARVARTCRFYLWSTSENGPITDIATFSILFFSPFFEK